MKYRQGVRLFVRVPRTPVTLAAGLLDLNGTQVLLVRRSTVEEARCWVVDPPLSTTLRKAAQGDDGRELLAGHRCQLAGLPEAWMTARAPTWSGTDLAFLRDHYGHWTTAVIAEHLGRGLAATRSKVEDLHLRCRTVWTPELDEILALLFPDTAAPLLADMLGATAAAIRQRALTLGIKKAPGFAAANSREMTLARSPFTPEIREVIELLYPDTLTEDMAELVGIPKARIHAYAAKYGLKKTREFMRDTARARTGPDHPMRRFQFPKGHVPANKGRKGVSFPGMEATQFKKGNRPITWKPIGSERLMDGYVQVKLTDTGYPPRDWVSKHVIVWEKANGRTVPPGHAVAFRDKNRTNFAEDNLELITRQELMRRNSYHTNLPPELRKLVQLRGVMHRMINKRQRELAEEQT